MNARTQLSMAVCAALLVESGCLVENLCDKEPTRAECVLVPSAERVTLLSLRLPLKGGELRVKAEGDPASVEAVLSPKGLPEQRLPLVRGADGEWIVKLKPQELWPQLGPGPLPLTLRTPQGSQDATLRLFVPPQFGPDVSRSARVLWLSVVNRHVITLEQGATERTFGDWTYQAPLLNRTGSIPASFGFTVPATALFAMTDSAFVRLMPSGSSWQLQQSPVGELRYTDIEPSVDYVSLLGLAVGKHGAGNLLAMAGEGGAGKGLRVFRLPDGGTAAAQKLAVDVTGPVAQLAVGGLDDNAEADLLTIGKDGTPSVLIGAGSGLALDAVASQSLAQQLGSEPVRALAVADLDRDGLADVVLSRKSQLQWLATQSDHSFTAPSVLVDLPDTASTLDVGLIDGNDSPDIAIGGPGLYLTAYLNQAP
ncbi:MAG: VCBS repeat-containing protein [Polyangia bacterium]